MMVTASLWPSPCAMGAPACARASSALPSEQGTLGLAASFTKQPRPPRPLLLLLLLLRRPEGWLDAGQYLGHFTGAFPCWSAAAAPLRCSPSHEHTHTHPHPLMHRVAVEAAEGRIMYRNSFATQKTSGPLANLFDMYIKNTSNTSVELWGDRLLTHFEVCGVCGRFYWGASRGPGGGLVM